MSKNQKRNQPASKRQGVRPERAVRIAEQRVISKAIASPIRASLMARERQIDNDINASVLKSNIPAMRSQQASAARSRSAQTGSKSLSKVSKKASKRRLDPHLQEWLDLVANPFEAPPAKCPINYNTAPSLNTTLARVDYVNFGLLITANTTTEIGLMGHGLPTSAVDQTSFHCKLQRIGLVTPVFQDFLIGPMGAPPTLPAMGYILQEMGTNLSTISTNVNFCSAIQPANPLPYTASLGNGNHTRWKLLAMGIELSNITQANQVAGDVVSVQPSTDFLASGAQLQGDYTRFPSFQVSSEANDGKLTRSWIPLTRDLAYSHGLPTSITPAAVSTENVPVKVWINNPSTNAQTYLVKIVWHYELTGANLVTVSSPAIMKPAFNQVVEPALEATRYLAHSAAPLPAVAAHVAANESPFVEDHSDSFLGDVMRQLGNRATSVAKDFLTSFI